MKKHRVLLLVLGLLTATIALSSCGSPAQDFHPVTRPVETSRPSNNLISARGIVESTERRNIYTSLGLTVQHVYVEVGDTVTAGQLLATLETYDLMLSIAQQMAAIELAQQNNETVLLDTRRMLDDAAANLNRGTNMHVISANTAFSMAAANLEAMQINYDIARLDYEEGNDPHLIAAENAVRDSRIALETLESNHQNLYALYTQGLLSREEFRQSGIAVQAAQNHYEDAQTAVQTVVDAQHRAIEQMQIQLNSARTAYRDARDVVNASRLAAQQEVATIQSHVEMAEIATNLEHMEIALAMLERQLEQTFITAPISGTVTAVHIREGAPGMGLLFVIEDIENLRVISGFREYDIGLLSTGMDVSITPTAAGVAAHTGVISRINPTAIEGSPVIEFEVEVLVTSPNSGLRVGMSTRTEIELE